ASRTLVDDQTRSGGVGVVGGRCPARRVCAAVPRRSAAFDSADMAAAGGAAAARSPNAKTNAALVSTTRRGPRARTGTSTQSYTGPIVQRAFPSVLSKRDVRSPSGAGRRQERDRIDVRHRR